MKTELKLSSREVTNGCKASVPASAAILSLSKRHASEQQDRLPLADAKTGHIVQNAAVKDETRTVETVAGPDYLLQDNEELNYRREQSFPRNIKRLPVRSEKLARRNQFLPPPRGKSRTTCTYKTPALCTDQEHQRLFTP